MFFFTLIFSETKDNLFDLLGRPTDLAVSNGAVCNRDKSDISISSRPPNIPLIHASAKAVVNLTSKLKNIEDIFFERHQFVNSVVFPIYIHKCHLS